MAAEASQPGVVLSGKRKTPSPPAGGRPTVLGRAVEGCVRGAAWAGGTASAYSEGWTLGWVRPGQVCEGVELISRGPGRSLAASQGQTCQIGEAIEGATCLPRN